MFWLGAAKGCESELALMTDHQMWSGCKDSQTSADTQEAGRATGAMSYVSSYTALISSGHMLCLVCGDRWLMTGNLRPRLTSINGIVDIHPFYPPSAQGDADRLFGS